jgi:hypothetical protein
VSGGNAVPQVFSRAQFEALKAHAKRLHRQRPGLSHVQALDIVAREQGFQNWALLARSHNRVEVQGPSVEPPVAPKPYIAKLRAIVRSRDRSAGNVWWDEDVPANHPEAYYERFEWMPENLQVAHVEEHVVRSQVSKMRRIIEFIDSSELKPSKAWVRLFGYGPIPYGMDHSAVWRDAQNRFIVSTEPYGGDRAIETVGMWCEEHGWTFAAAKQGQGIWNPCPPTCEPGCPGHSRLLLMAPPKNGGDPREIAERLQ